MGKKLIYAGIGSRKTPDLVLRQMESIGQQLGESGWHLRSGFADGADKAFGRGAETVSGSFEMILPWEGFNGAPKDDPRFYVPQWSAELLEIAAAAHPVWERLTDTVKCLHARNVPQVLGWNVREPADMVVCWTPNAKSGGGTGQAIRVAKMRGIPVFDLADPAQCQTLVDFVAAREIATALSEANKSEMF